MVKPLDRIVLSEYDVYGNVIASVDASDMPHRRSEVSYDDKLKMFAVETRQVGDKITLTSKSEYNYSKAFGKPVKQTDANGNSSYISYDAYGRISRTRIDTDDGAKTVADYFYSAEYPLSSKTIQYTGTGKGDIETRVFSDGLGRHIHTIQTALEEDGKRYTKTGKTVYDALGRVIRQSQIDWARDDEIDRYVAHSQEKNVTTIEYDGSGRVKFVSKPRAEGETKDTTIHYAYNDPYEVVITHSVGQNKRTISNGRGQVLYIEDFGTGDDGKTVRAMMGFCYNLAGARVKREDIPSLKLQAINCEGEDTSVKLLAASKDLSGKNISRWEYDGFGQLVASSDPDLGYSAASYNGFGDVVRREDARGRVTTMEYDSLGRMVKELLPTGEGEVVYTFDTGSGDNALGRLVAMEDSIQRKEFSYNRKGEIKQEKRIMKNPHSGDYAEEFTTKFKKDLLNRDTRIDYPRDPNSAKGIRVCYRYNSMGYVSGIDSGKQDDGTACTGQGKIAIISNIDYNEFGQRTRVDRGNGTSTVYKYDIKGRLTNLVTIGSDGQEKIQNINYTFNVDNSIREVENNPNVNEGGVFSNKYGSKYEYRYDGLNRLVQAKGNYNSYSKAFKREYSYASNGNLMSKSFYNINTGSLKDKWNYFYTNHAVHNIYSTKTGDDRFSMDYDEVGNMIEQIDHVDDKTKVMEFDSLNRIVKINNPNATDNYKQVVGRYYYDRQGFRVRKISRRDVETDEDTQYREFETLHPSKFFGLERQRGEPQAGSDKLQAGKGKIIDNSTFIVNHIYLEGVRVAALSPVGDDFSARFYLTNHIDSVKLVTDGDGMVVSRTEYYPYGETFVNEGEEKSLPKFGSQELDKESGYYFFNTRHYDPQVSRFVTADTVIDGEGDTQGWNRYSYVKGNPVGYKDPSGHLAYNTDDESWYIEKGDTLKKIAKQTGFKLKKIIKENGQIENPNKISIGNKINIPQSERIKTFQSAASKIGDTEYAKKNKVDDYFDEGINKCNKFVSDVFETGTDSKFPKTNSKKLFIFDRNAPALAGELADSKLKLKNTEVISGKDAKIGDIVSWKREYSDASGHTAIFAGKVNIVKSDKLISPGSGATGSIGAGTHSVNYRSSTYMKEAGYENPVYRKSSTSD